MIDHPLSSCAKGFFNRGFDGVKKPGGLTMTFSGTGVCNWGFDVVAIMRALVEIAKKGE